MFVIMHNNADNDYGNNGDGYDDHDTGCGCGGRGGSSGCDDSGRPGCNAGGRGGCGAGGRVVVVIVVGWLWCWW